MTIPPTPIHRLGPAYLARINQCRLNESFRVCLIRRTSGRTEVTYAMERGIHATSRLMNEAKGRLSFALHWRSERACSYARSDADDNSTRMLCYERHDSPELLVRSGVLLDLSPSIVRYKLHYGQCRSSSFGSDHCRQMFGTRARISSPILNL